MTCDISEWEDVKSAFEMDEPEPDELIFYEYDQSGWDGDATVVYRRGDTYYVVQGGHCSCHGLEGQFDPIEYTLEELIKSAQRADGWGTMGSAWKTIRQKYT